MVGLVAAGVRFILPAALMVAGLAWAYVEYGDTPAVEDLLYGVVPAVIAIIVFALVGLLRTVVLSRPSLLARIGLAVIAAGALTAYALGVNELVVILGLLFLTMLKIGSVLLSSGYVLLAFLEGDLVDRLGRITQEQLRMFAALVRRLS